MGKHIKIERKYYDDRIIHLRTNIEINEGVTVLVGCNGFGKTTMMRQIIYFITKQNIPNLSFDNLHDGGSHSISKHAFHQNFTTVANLICSSEGENILMNFGLFSQNIRDYIIKNSHKKEFWLFIDSTDSGLSIDNIDEVKLVFDLIIDDCNKLGVTPYIIVTTNTYEFARGENCYDVYSCKYIKFTDYEDYRKFIINSSKRKEKRNNRRN